jgi:8-oxo-dGTP pyrophosphatase MutT (NUDIX family)
LITKSLEAIEIAPLDAVEIAVEPWIWPFAQARRADMDRHFAARRRERPALWNGRVLLLHRYARENGVLRGASFETDYASFLAWRDWGCPTAGVFNVFADAALQSADGAFLLGQMAPFTSLAGQWVFPGGTPDRDDISPGGMLDLAGSVARELLEETGLDIGACKVEPEFSAIRIVRGPADLDPATPRFLVEYLAVAWSQSVTRPMR